MEPVDQQSRIVLKHRLSKGHPAPLFERLVDNSALAKEPLRSHDPGNSAESVRRELERILNTRSLPPADVAAECSVVNYGLQDFTIAFPTNTLELMALSRHLASVIETFEPRLKNVRVELQADPLQPSKAVGRLQAEMHVRMVSEPVSFPLELGRGSQASLSKPVGAEIQTTPVLAVK